MVPPWESPDGRWHMFANGILGLYHFVGEDGIDWEPVPPTLFGPGAFRAHVYREGADYWLLYEQYLSLTTSEIRIVHSTDLATWSEPVLLLAPELEWEEEFQSRIGNPFLIRRDDTYWLYYSAGGTMQEDTGFAEPRHIGLARATSLDGPWTREPEPLLSPSPDTPYRNQGAGSMKLLEEQLAGFWVAFNNGIFEDDEGNSRSAIQVLASVDGLSWEPACNAPVIQPESDTWKHAFVYAFDPVWVEDTLRLYYNARDGWEVGTERIGLATATIPR